MMPAFYFPVARAASKTKNKQMMDEPKLSIIHISGWRVWLPAALLTGVAIFQIVLASTADIISWKGGGFGMFATIDGPSTRRVRIFVEAPGRSEELDLAAPQRTLEKQARVFPSDQMLLSLAKAVSDREMRSGRPVSTVTLEVWRAEYNDRLEATDRLLRNFSWNVDQQAYNGR